MQGSSRDAVLESRPALETALTHGRPAALSEDLFAITGLLDEQATLRRTLVDPTREGSGKGELIARLLGGQVGEDAVSIVSTMVAQRWSRERDLTDTIERFAVEALLKGAEEAGAIEQVEDELFRFERVVAGDAALRDALGNRAGDPHGKAELVSRLLQGKAQEQTVALVRQAVLAPRGRRFDRTVEEYLDIAAERRQQLTAIVTTAGDLGEEQRTRLATALQRTYGTAVLLQVVVDESVVGGIHVQIGDEVVDGTVARRLDETRRHLAG